MRRKLTAALLAASLLTLAACGNDGDTSSTIDESETFNQADVDFATDMIQHHAQALSMVDLTVGRELTPELAGLTEQIRMAQGPEIETMVDWLQEWDQPVPETVRDHAGAHGDDHGDGHDEMDSDMPGMMSAEDMADLEAADGAEFEQTWLEMMIEHHEGAIDMARTEQEDGKHPDAVALAEEIETDQTAEIATMDGLLDEQDGSAPPAGDDGAVGHIHGIGVDPADDAVYVATHHGLFHLDGSGDLSRVADGRQDTMGFAVAGPGDFLASGHPDPRDDLPPHLGLIESSDAGVTWRSLARQGESDFHILEQVGGDLYAYDATTGQLLVTQDRLAFDEVAQMPLLSITEHPDDPGMLLGTTDRGVLVAIDPDRGDADELGGPTLVLLDTSPEGDVVGIDPAGTVHVRNDSGAGWESRGGIGGVPAALAVADGRWYAATERQVFGSEDGGSTWTAAH